MRFAPVCPPHIYQRIVHSQPYLLQYVLLLAHDVVAHPKTYREVFINKRPPGCFIIMDNSLIELGGAADLPMVREACKIVRASTYVLPDVYEKSMETLEASLEAMPKWREEIHDAEPFFLPQGETFHNWARCLWEFLQRYPQLKYVGIPRNTTKRICDSRRQLVDVTRTFTKRAHIHLFGFSNYVIDDLTSARHPDVMGIDSAVPVRVGSRGQVFTPFVDPGPRGDWWEKAEYSLQIPENLGIVGRLISPRSLLDTMNGR
jgi:hypothetical protein